MIDPHIAYQALASRDPRFDGVFFTGVTSTGIYCRPICPVKTPQAANCRFFENAAAAEKSGFRPCLRCRPELAPGLAPVDSGQRIAHLLNQHLDEHFAADDARLESLAARFGISSRQLRRIIRKELGVSPIEFIQTRRLLLAKQLLTETALPVIDVAFASGFSSLRRFNDAFLSHYRMPPSHLRKRAAEAPVTAGGGTSKLTLAYRPPYDWEAILEFLRHRTLLGIERVHADSYLRTVRLGTSTGWIRVSHAAEKSALSVEFSHSLSASLPALLARLRHLFDLAARPDLIAAQLAHDPLLADSFAKHPGLRVPGSFERFEMAVRAILGQQITVKAATTLACRFVQAFGESLDAPFPELNRLSPLPAAIAKASIDEIAGLGIVRARAKSLISLAQAFEEGALDLETGRFEEVIPRLASLPGIGPWTAHYIAMRGLRWPDAFPKEDIAVRKSLGGVTARRAEILSQAWRPWRSYAVMHLWKNPSPGA